MSSPDVEETRSDAKRKRVKKACVPCSKAHVSCENIRPCKRCVDKGLIDKCVDKQRKPRVETTEIVSTSTPQIDSVQYSEITIETPANSIVTTPATSSDHDPDSVDAEIESNFFAVTLHLATQSTEDNIDHVIKQETFLTNAISDALRGRFESVIPKSQFNKLMLETSQIRLKSWKYLTSRHRPEKLLCADLCVFAISESPRLVQSMKETIEQYRPAMEPLAAPVIFFDRCGTIHYVNTAYKTLTGFQYNIPTAITEFAFYKHIISPETFVEMLMIENKIMEEQPDFGTVNAYVIKCGVRAHREIGEKYIKGNMTLNFKKDFLGIPLLYIGTFFPTEFSSWIFKDSHKHLAL